jgi:hypothetical protein
MTDIIYFGIKRDSTYIVEVLKLRTNMSNFHTESHRSSSVEHLWAWSLCRGHGDAIPKTYKTGSRTVGFFSGGTHAAAGVLQRLLEQRRALSQLSRILPTTNSGEGL